MVHVHIHCHQVLHLCAFRVWPPALTYHRSTVLKAPLYILLVLSLFRYKFLHMGGLTGDLTCLPLPVCLPPLSLSCFLHSDETWRQNQEAAGRWISGKGFTLFTTLSALHLSLFPLPFLLVQALSHLISKSKDNIHYVVTQYICCEMMQCLRPK